MKKVITDNLTIEPLGNLLDIQITAPDPTGQISLATVGPIAAWLAKPGTPIRVSCSLSVDAAMDLRDEIAGWLASIGASDPPPDERPGWQRGHGYWIRNATEDNR